MSDLLTDGTAPWWSVPVTALVTLGVSGLLNLWANRGQREAAREENRAAREHALEESSAAREHALALLEKEQASRAEVERSGRQAEEAKERQRESLEDSVRAIEAISRMRSAVVLSALAPTQDEFGDVVHLAQPISRDLLDEFVASLARLSLHDDLQVNFDGKLEMLNTYVSGWASGHPPGDDSPHERILTALDGLRDEVADNYRTWRYWRDQP